MGELQMTQAKRWTFDEQESEKDVQQREQAVTRAQGYARSAVSMGGIFPRTCPFVAARTSHRPYRPQEHGLGRKILRLGSDGNPRMCA